MLENPYRATGGLALGSDVPAPSTDAARPLALLERCPDYSVTPLADFVDPNSGAKIFVKDERNRMGLGSFKALGAAYVIAFAVQKGDLSKETYVTASAGNHGLSVAAGARVFGAKAVIYLSQTVPQDFANRLEHQGATVVRAGDNYEASMQAAAQAAQDNGWTLLSDSSWPGYTELPHRLMEGYLALAAETVEQMPKAPDYIFLQAGVGGLAGAAAAYFRSAWGDGPTIIVVEPDAAPALYQSIKQGRVVATSGPVSNMGRLDCKEPSMIALAGLSRDADFFHLMSDAAVDHEIAKLTQWGLETSASGGAGVAAALSGVIDFNSDDTVLCILSEGQS